MMHIGGSTVQLFRLRRHCRMLAETTDNIINVNNKHHNELFIDLSICILYFLYKMPFNFYFKILSS